MHAHKHYCSPCLQRQRGKGCSVEMCPVSRTWGTCMQLHQSWSLCFSLPPLPPSLQSSSPFLARSSNPFFPLIVFSSVYSPWLISFSASVYFWHKGTSWHIRVRQGGTASLATSKTEGGQRVAVWDLEQLWSPGVGQSALIIRSCSWVFS